MPWSKLSKSAQKVILYGGVMGFAVFGVVGVAVARAAVEVEGVDLTYLPLRVEETFWRMLRYGEFDVAEMSTGSFLMSRDKGASWKPIFDYEYRRKP